MGEWSKIFNLKIKHYDLCSNLFRHGRREMPSRGTREEKY